MTRHFRKLTSFALAAGLASFTVLGLAGPAEPSLDRQSPDVIAVGTERPDPGAARIGRACCTERGVECCCSLTISIRQDQKDQKDQKDKEGKDGKDEKKASPEAKSKGDAARKAIVEQRQVLAKEGVWDCCIAPGCVFCQTAADGCPCAASLKKGSAVCPECWGGWQAGHGQIKGIDPNRVPIPSKDTLKKLYDMKAKNLEKTSGDSDKK